MISCELLPHQKTAAHKLAGLKVGALFMEMGTGKTVAVMELIRQRRHKISKVVYLTPVNLKSSVKYEFSRHAPTLDVFVFDDKTKDGSIPAADVYVVGIESIGQSDRVTLATNSLIDESACVILDESDSCKNHAAMRTRRITAMSARARYRFALTGTPVGEGVVDLYAQMKFLSPQILGYKSFYSFAANHLEYSEDYPGLIVRSLNTDYIAKKIEPFVYQVTKAECLDLPKKQYRSRHFGMTPEQESFYRAAKEDILMRCPEDELDSYVIFRLFTALREIVSGFWNQTPHPESWHCCDNLKAPVLHTFDHDRLDTLCEAVSEHDQKTIVWVNFQYCAGQVTQRLTHEYGAGMVATYHGQTENREQEIERWRNGARFLVASPRCGGRGLTLNEATHAVFYNNDFPYRLRAQAEDRNHRIGQTQRPIYTDIATDGIDDRIVTALTNKESMAQQFKAELDKLQTPGEKRQKLLQL